MYFIFFDYFEINDFDVLNIRCNLFSNISLFRFN